MIEINKIDMVNFIDKNTKKSILKLNDVKNTSIHQKCETVCNYTLKGECKCINKNMKVIYHLSLINLIWIYL